MIVGMTTVDMSKRVYRATDRSNCPECSVGSSVISPGVCSSGGKWKEDHKLGQDGRCLLGSVYMGVLAAAKLCV
jgi:hypothetical protein